MIQLPTAPGSLAARAFFPGAAYDMGIAPGSSWPNSLSFLNQNAYGAWEMGAYVYPH